jgi:predicted GTPase
MMEMPENVIIMGAAGRDFHNFNVYFRNDTPFFKPDIHVVVFDPHRPGHETAYHPGETK